jgi:DNA helicase TIP49 (TBP-interacting protein)
MLVLQMPPDEQGRKMTRHAAGGLIGRDRDLGFLLEFFRQAAPGGGALVLSGDPGMGKTALLNALAQSEPRRGPWCCA